MASRRLTRSRFVAPRASTGASVPPIARPPRPAGLSIPPRFEIVNAPSLHAENNAAFVPAVSSTVEPRGNGPSALAAVRPVDAATAFAAVSPLNAATPLDVAATVRAPVVAVSALGALSSSVEPRLAVSSADGLISGVTSANLGMVSDGQVESPSTPATSSGGVSSELGVTAPTKWTVTDPGRAQPPTSDDYSTWTLNQLRKECTQRKLRLPRKTTSEERIAMLQRHDAMQQRVEAPVDEENELPQSLRKTRHWCARLLNILFSDSFSVRFAQIGDKATRQELDTGALNANSGFWKDVTTEFHTNTTDYNIIWSSDDRFDDTNPSIIVPHSRTKLVDMWKTVNRNYVKALARYTQSGTHDSDFFQFCGGCLDAAYLRAYLQLKPDLTSFVHGGMLEKDEMDSLKRTSRDPPVGAPLPKKWQSDLVASVNNMSEFIIASARQEECAREEKQAGFLLDDILERVAKLHSLRGEMQARLDFVAEQGTPDILLKKTIAFYDRRLLTTSTSLRSSSKRNR